MTISLCAFLVVIALFGLALGNLSDYIRDTQGRGMDRRSRGRLAQLVERFVYTEDVSGSSPLSPTISQILAPFIDPSCKSVTHSQCCWPYRRHDPFSDSV
jgi:hypothetical protein